MTRPLALDLFCCAGGSTIGLQRAGFDVIGVDWKPSKHWCGDGEVHEVDLSTADAVEAVVLAFAPDFVSSSPPCQRFSAATPTKNRADHPDLIDSTRQGLLRAGVPAWIENVNGAPLHHAIRLCGSMFPETQRLKRHRFFELLGWWTMEPEHVDCTFDPVCVKNGSMGTNSRRARARRDLETVHEGSNARAARERRRTVSVAGNGPPDAAQQARYRRAVVTVSGDNGANPGGVPGTSGQNRPGPECVRWREALGWLDGPKDRYSLAQAVPPAYAAWLGYAFLNRTKALDDYLSFN